jgi:hypothetical protein
MHIRCGMCFGRGPFFPRGFALAPAVAIVVTLR